MRIQGCNLAGNGSLGKRSFHRSASRMSHDDKHLNAKHGSAVVVVAEGAGQDILAATGTTDASGNTRLGDIGLHLKEAIVTHFAAAGEPLTLKYLDPGYLVRSVPADPHDAVYCLRLAHAAVHAGVQQPLRVAADRAGAIGALAAEELDGLLGGGRGLVRHRARTRRAACRPRRLASVGAAGPGWQVG